MLFHEVRRGLQIHDITGHTPDKNIYKVYGAFP